MEVPSAPHRRSSNENFISTRRNVQLHCGVCLLRSPTPIASSQLLTARQRAFGYMASPSFWGIFLIWLSRSLPADIARHHNPISLLFLGFSLLLFLSGTLFIAYRLAGRTYLEFSDTELNVRDQLLGFSFSPSTLSLEDLPEPYFVEEDHEAGSSSKTPSCIRFDFANGSYSCCPNIPGDEAYEVIEAIRKTFPELAKNWGSGSHLHSKDIISLNLT